MLNAFPTHPSALPARVTQGPPILNTIRVETAFRYPIHQLDKAKIGTPIEITKSLGNGAKEYWRVKHTPGPLSYQIDSLVINRKLDEVGWEHLPQLLPIGSLSSICRMLNRSDSGTSRRDIREALEKNAGALITADFQYQLKPAEKPAKNTSKAYANFRGTFSRYAVYFTGMTLPNGVSADCTYVHFNHLYFQALKNATLRPLDYDYLKALTVGAQKFYEIVSYRIFAALTQRRDSAWISYNDYCLYSNQRRYSRRSQVITQMNRLQQPHVESGYLGQFATYIDCYDNQGQKDWKIVLIPGAKSRDEYQFFTKKKLPQYSHIRKVGSHEVILDQDKTSGNLSSGMVTELASLGVPRVKAQALVELFPDRVEQFLKEPGKANLSSLVPDSPSIEQLNFPFSQSTTKSPPESADLLLKFRAQFSNLGIRVTPRVKRALDSATEATVEEAFRYVENYQTDHRVRSKAGLFVAALEQGWRTLGTQDKPERKSTKTTRNSDYDTQTLETLFHALPQAKRQEMTREALEALPSRYQGLLARVHSEDLKKKAVESAVLNYWKGKLAER